MQPVDLSVGPQKGPDLEKLGHGTIQIARLTEMDATNLRSIIQKMGQEDRHRLNNLLDGLQKIFSYEPVTPEEKRALCDKEGKMLAIFHRLMLPDAQPSNSLSLGQVFDRCTGLYVKSETLFEKLWLLDAQTQKLEIADDALESRVNQDLEEEIADFVLVGEKAKTTEETSLSSQSTETEEEVVVKISASDTVDTPSRKEFLQKELRHLNGLGNYFILDRLDQADFHQLQDSLTEVLKWTSHQQEATAADSQEEKDLGQKYGNSLFILHAAKLICFIQDTPSLSRKDLQEKILKLFSRYRDGQKTLSGSLLQRLDLQSQSEQVTASEKTQILTYLTTYCQKFIKARTTALRNQIDQLSG